MTSTSQRMRWLQADESQSGLPRSTSSTNWNLSGGKLLRNASFSSAELTVIVQTVFLSACALCGQATASSMARHTVRVGPGTGQRIVGICGRLRSIGRVSFGMRSTCRWMTPRFHANRRPKSVRTPSDLSSVGARFRGRTAPYRPAVTSARKIPTPLLAAYLPALDRSSSGRTPTIPEVADRRA